MTAATQIPDWIERELANPAAPGGRHAQIVKLAPGLLRAGLTPGEVFDTLRKNYASDLPDQEIWQVISWGSAQANATPRRPSNVSDRSIAKMSDPVENVKRVLDGFECSEADLWEKSPIRPPENWESDSVSLLTHLYHPAENVNIVADFSNQGGKLNPRGKGLTKPAAIWIQEFEKNGPPRSDAGTWVRINPVDGLGISDSNVTHFRFLLLEFDSIPIELQLAFFARLPLPIAAIISSAGKSIHAWIWINSKTREDFSGKARIIFRELSQFGLDPSNKNPSRLSRLPGVLRPSRKIADHRQRLLFLAPHHSQCTSIL